MAFGRAFCGNPSEPRRWRSYSKLFNRGATPRTCGSEPAYSLSGRHGSSCRRCVLAVAAYDETEKTSLSCFANTCSEEYEMCNAAYYY